MEIDCTAILLVYKRKDVFETQLNCLLKQSYKPKEIWVCFFNSPYSTFFRNIIEKYQQENSNKTKIRIIESDFSFAYYGRFQMALQVKTEYVVFYDDDRFPNFRNLEYYWKLVKSNPKYLNSILGQWGWKVQPPNEKQRNGEESFVMYNKSKFITNGIKDWQIREVDYLCGHWFLPTKFLFLLFKDGLSLSDPLNNNLDQTGFLKFETGEDIALSFRCFINKKIKSYVCSPKSVEYLIGHNESGVMSSTLSSNMLSLRNKMIVSYSGVYQFVEER